MDLGNISEVSYSKLVPLNGEWKFSWERLVGDLEEGEITKNAFYLKVPSSWRGVEYLSPDTGQKLNLSSNGYATYELELILPKIRRNERISFYIRDFGSSYRFYLDGELLSSNGNPGRTKEEYSPYMKNHIVNWTVPGDKVSVHLAVEVANFDNKDAGFWNPILIGDMERIQTHKERIRMQDVFLIGAMFIIGLYSVSFYIFLGKEKSSLFFGMFSLILTLRIGITGERIFLDFFPNLPFWLVYKLEYLSFYMATPMFMMYLKSLFPYEIPQKTFRVFIGIYIGFIMIVLFSTADIYSQTVHFYQGLTLLFIIPAILTLIRGMRRKKSEALLIIVSSLILMLSVINDILYHNNIFKIVLMVPYGFLQFTFVQSLILGRKFAIAFKKIDEYAKNYKRLNIHLETIVQERTQDLNDKINHIHKDLDMAKLVQIKSLGKNMKNSYDDQLKISHLYEPMTEIGGDFYDIYEYKKDTIRIFLADATGHGIQAALVMMAIKVDYEYAKRKFEDPSMIMNFLNREFTKKYKDLRVFYTCVFLEINLKERIITYSKAGHPEPIIVRRGNIIPLAGKGMIVGFQENTSFSTYHTFYETGDRLYLFTDGVIEQILPDGSMYGEDRFFKSLIASHDLNLDSALLYARDSLWNSNSSQNLSDDIAIIGLELY